MNNKPIRILFTLNEVKEVNDICFKCKLSNHIYCNKYNTDSIVFKVNRCNYLQKYNNI